MPSGRQRHALFAYIVVLVSLALVLGIGIPLHVGPVVVGVATGAIVAAVLIPVTVKQVRAVKRENGQAPPQS